MFYRVGRSMSISPEQSVNVTKGLMPKRET